MLRLFVRLHPTLVYDSITFYVVFTLMIVYIIVTRLYHNTCKTSRLLYVCFGYYYFYNVIII